MVVIGATGAASGSLRADSLWAADCLRNLGLASHTLSARPVFDDRVAPRDVEELSALVRGLTRGHPLASAIMRSSSQPASHALRSAVVRIHVSVAGAYTLSWAALDTEAGGALLTFGRADERTGARLDRLLGSVRRSLGEPDAITLESQGAA